jgi:hypothetical protein
MPRFVGGAGDHGHQDVHTEVLGMQVERWCAECAAQVAFVEFDCDDHVDDCLELVCTLCGAGYEGALADAGVRPATRGKSRRLSA